MAADDRRGDDGGGDRHEHDYHYFGPFAPPRPGEDADRSGGPEHATPLGVGHWSYGEEQPPAPPAHPHQPAPYGSAFFPAPAGVQPWGPSVPGRPVLPPAPAARRTGGRLVLLAALTALVVGGAAGYGGSRLAAVSATAPQTSAAPPAATSAPPAPATPYKPPPGQPNNVGVAKVALPSTVMIQVGTGSGGGSGSGFVLDRQGRIMTNNHVVSAAAQTGRIRVVFADGTRKAAKLVGRSPSYDLAVIAVDPGPQLTPIGIGDSTASQVGEPVVAVGSPLGLPGTVTAGIVSAKNRPVVVNNSGNADAASAYINAIQTDAPINPGNSGGPLIDSQARVIGVNSAILTLGQNREQSGSIGLGFAIPINQAMDIGQQLIKRGKASYPVIGANVNDDRSSEGVELSGLEASGPAAKSRLRVGDVVTSIDGQRVDTSQELIVAIRTHRPGDRVTLSYRRGGQVRQAVVILGGKDG